MTAIISRRRFSVRRHGETATTSVFNQQDDMGGNSRMRKVYGFFVCGMVFAGLVASAAPASAQDLSLGYQYQHISGGGESLNAPVGVNADIGFPLSRGLGVVGQVDWSHKSESATVVGTSIGASANFLTFGGGVRWTGDGASAKPYVQALFGATRVSADANVAGSSIASASSTDAMLQIGGGVAVPVSGKLNVIGQVDYRRIFESGGGSNSIRFVGGIRISMK